MTRRTKPSSRSQHRGVNILKPIESVRERWLRTQPTRFQIATAEDFASKRASVRAHNLAVLDDANMWDQELFPKRQHDALPEAMHMPDGEQQ